VPDLHEKSLGIGRAQILEVGRQGKAGKVVAKRDRPALELQAFEHLLLIGPCPLRCDKKRGGGRDGEQSTHGTPRTVGCAHDPPL
jgi:hypothetical protein